MCNPVSTTLLPVTSRVKPELIYHEIYRVVQYKWHRSAILLSLPQLGFTPPGQMAATTTTVISLPVPPPGYQDPMTSSNDPTPLEERSISNPTNLEAFGQGTGAVAHAIERWDYPRINTYRLAAIFFSFLNFGMNDGSYGALVPYVCTCAGF